MRLKTFGNEPEWLVNVGKRMLDRPVDLSNRRIHVTQLLQPAAQLGLMNDNWKSLDQSADSLIPALLGSAWHEYIEGSMTGGICEQRHEHRHTTPGFDEWTIIGTPDFYRDTTLIDFKTTKTWSRIFGGKVEWEQQLNIYRWLIYQQSGEVMENLEIHAIYVDWMKNAALRNDEYPRQRWEVINIPVWTLDDAEAFIDERLIAIEASSTLDVCSPAERWERGEHWAVMKEGRKTAVKKHDTEEGAAEHATEDKRYYVEHREGTPVRCLDWCSVKHLCEFGKTLDDA